ncbi:hypothetical protein PV04_09824 [Phialophora macrospora]|uniref:Fe2OG dioxygenase domain-containing protein n=1 Tax=Phialophora macrospora TaxID=1851006 RepID=A0A0D2DKL0_9EURO|nr:hypothetical protein PV04_09824 [Phialophora macrospora]
MVTATETTTTPPEQQYVTFHAAKGTAQRPILTGKQMKKTFESIPQIDFRDMHGSSVERKRLADQVGSAFKECGFLYACNHGISEELQARVLDVMREFFALPQEEKMKIHINHSSEIKGYECLLETKLDTTTRGDLKEALNFGEDPTEPEQNCPPGFDLSYYPGNGTVPINQWPAKPENFRSVMYQYHAAVMAFSRQLLHIIALALDVEEEYFDKLTEFPMAGLRPLYYPPQELASDIGIGAHADYSWFTVVNQLTDCPALEVLNANGHWVGAPPLKNTLVVNVGDFLERATNEVFVSTVHRVVNKTPGAERYSIPLFFSPSHNAMIDVIPTCWDENRPKMSEPILAGKWQRERLYRSRYKHPAAIAATARGAA